MIKRFLGALLNVISVAAIAVALVALLAVVFTPAGNVPTLGGYSVLRVLTGSMEPALPTNTLILVVHTPAAEIETGDVISFYSTDPQLGGAINTHRVAEVQAQGDSYQFTTQGDANPLPDTYPVTEDNLIGKVVGSSALLGTVVTFLANPLAFVLLVVLPLLGMTIYNLYKVIRSAHDVMKAEEQAAIAQALADAKRKREEK